MAENAPNVGVFVQWCLGHSLGTVVVGEFNVHHRRWLKYSSSTATTTPAGRLLCNFCHAYGFEELGDLIPAYAISVHRSQGSEYPAVVVPVSTDHFLMLRRSLLYTAITRGKRLVVLVGSRRALEMATRNNDDGRR